jgi:hypothetical protein
MDAAAKDFWGQLHHSRAAPVLHFCRANHLALKRRVGLLLNATVD